MTYIIENAEHCNEPGTGLIQVNAAPHRQPTVRLRDTPTAPRPASSTAERLAFGFGVKREELGCGFNANGHGKKGRPKNKTKTKKNPRSPHRVPHRDTNTHKITLRSPHHSGCILKVTSKRPSLLAYFLFLFLFSHTSCLFSFFNYKSMIVAF